MDEQRRQDERRLGGDRRRRRRVDRRRGNDSFLKAVSWMGFFGWAAFVFALFFWRKARPTLDNLAMRFSDEPYRFEWDPGQSQYLLFMLIIGLLISVVGLFINSQRNRRKTDGYRINLILLLVFSVLGLGLFFLTTDGW